MLSKEENKEQNEVSLFLATSYEFKKMKAIATVNPHTENYTNWVECIENCDTLEHILYHTADIDPATTDNILAYQLGRNKVNAGLYVLGCFSNHANFTYFLLHLRETVQDYLSNRRDNQSSLDSLVIAQ